MTDLMSLRFIISKTAKELVPFMCVSNQFNTQRPANFSGQLINIGHCTYKRLSDFRGKKKHLKVNTFFFQIISFVINYNTSYMINRQIDQKHFSRLVSALFFLNQLFTIEMNVSE